MGGFLSDIPGIAIAHQSLGDTGCSVIIARDSATCAVDVRGGGPGTRETDLLEPHNTVQRVHAIALSGGSAYGLAVADGVMAALEEAGIGFPVLGPEVPGPIVPIVPAAVIFDLLVGDPHHRPTKEDGIAATKAALKDGKDQRSGSIGAGVAATAGVLRGGFGQASMHVGPDNQWRIACGIVANPVGRVADPNTGQLYADPSIRVDRQKFAALKPLLSKLNTTIGVIATDAPITKAQAKRIAMVGHDGIARAIQPAHSPLDGDTLFCLSTGADTGVDIAMMGELSAAAAQVVSAAILDALLHAQPAFSLPTVSLLRVQ
ncbi:P1 family peptidase [Corynebacterium sp. ES2794-CONJ1]|uniref:P1 family peptidase n=1 Tax=unclassified Corynebacterium TaxID=2624378 RepID=UPI00216A5D98|nr:MULTISPECIES: P1 family peptidase [unclassified Corynebacterium]MCS4490650.1 P1 family peptidase [Corynebacterium sp. ES2775-CONJ]MCS4492452.1 P1 family peptidase [Corynebacterium sp. ES2715-CONJ3]MCS4532584.1 P1 family peptidase [Corynebacterium sp. ES2730-CONJ]MCU9519979.1 P1 family peptidase [Corynebacterium sp. ES2794-CONJ1]